jgi:hypothetical protein
MGVVQNIVGMVRDINERRENARIQDVLRNNLNNPEAAFQSIYQIDPFKGQAYQDDQTKRSTAAEEAKTKRIDARLGRLKQATGFLRGVPQEQLGAAFDRFQPLFDEIGVDPQALSALREQALTNPEYLATLDDETYDAMMKDRYTTRTLTPGAEALKNGEVVHRVPYKLDPVTVGSSQTGYTTSIFDPNKGEFLPDDGSGPAVGPAAPMEELPPAQLLPARATGEQVEALAVSAVPGINVTSRGRTPEHNRRVGGDEDSFHLTTRGARARDFTPPPGMSMGELHQTLRSAYGSGWDVINEGDHVHVEPGSGGGAPAQMAQGGQGAQVGRRSIRVPAAPPKPTKSSRTLSREEAAAKGYPAGAIVQVDSTGKETVTYRPPASQTRDAGDAQAQAEAREQLGGMLGGMASQYVELAKAGGIVDPRSGTLENIGARIASSGPGQFVGGIVGTEEQSIRQSIRNTQPLLMQQIRQATEMGARGLDSNKELEFYQQAASDPSKDLVSNLSALLVLDMAYGSQDGSAVLGSLPLDLRNQVVERASGMMRQRGTQFGQERQTQSGVAEGTIIRNPSTGARKIMRDGKWEDL